MNAEIIAVGSEMLTAGRLDTNSLFITSHLNELGIEVTAKHVIGDDRCRLVTGILRCLGDADIVILSGGLGPTEDDLTRDSVAQALGLALLPDAGVRESLERRFRIMQRAMPEINLRQALVLEGAEILSNDRGTAPGQWLASGPKFIILLPGPPSELKSMFERECLPRLAKIAPPAAIHTSVLRVTGISESQLDTTIAPLYQGRENLVTTVLAHDGDLQVHFRAHCATSAEATALSNEVAELAGLKLGDHVYSRNGDPLEAVIGKRLSASGQTLAVAESATSGGLAERITRVPGSSAYFLGGYVTYSKKLKTALLGIPESLLTEKGAVSSETAQAMAEGARRTAASDWAVAITGNAGPATDGAEAPVGAMHIAVSGPGGTTVTHRVWPLNDRGRVRAFAIQAALDLLNRRLASETK
jgi:nicotinamide-nucleotide amidase